MVRAELIPVRPIPVLREGQHTSALAELDDIARAPVPLKLYRPGDALLVASFASTLRNSLGRVEGRGAEGMTVLSGAAEAGDGEGKWRAVLTLAGDHWDRLIYLARGALTLHLVGDEREETLDVETPELLIFPPDGDLSFAPRGLPIELLRDIAEVASLPVPLAAPPWKGFVDKVFGGNPPRYDVKRGAPHFTDLGNPVNWNKLTFHLRRYNAARQDPNALLNCYDAAAYLQILLRPTYLTRYCYMNRFGYLRRTNLIGRGSCNNPFTKFTAPLVVPEASRSRTGFGNHAFCAPSHQGSEYIADACAGPHYNDTPATYVGSAVDTVTPNPPRYTRGTIANFRYYRGVVNIQNLVRVGTEMTHFMTELPEIQFEENRDTFMRAIGYRPVGELAESLPRHIADPSRHRALTKWELVYEDQIVGYPESSRQWRYVRGEQSFVVTCWVANGPWEARERFLLLGSAHESAEPVFERGPEGLGEVSAQSLGDAMPTLMWSQGNITFQLQTTDEDFELAALAFDLARTADERASPASPPEIDLKASPALVRVGETFSILVETPDGVAIEFALSSDLATLEGENGHELSFMARAPGSLQISVAAADPRTLLSAQRTEAVRIVDSASEG